MAKNDWNAWANKKCAQEGKPNKYRNKNVSYKGVKFASEIECYCYKSLEGVFDFEFQKTIELQPSFERGIAFDIAEKSVWGEGLGILRQGKERAIKMIVDFYLQFEDFDVLIDTKGFATPDWLIKAKMLEFQLAQKEKTTLFFTPSDENEILVIMSKLKNYAKRV